MRCPRPFFAKSAREYLSFRHRTVHQAREARERVEAALLGHQEPDGSWAGADGSENGQGKVYCTAMALLSLSVRHHFLPIYQD